MASPDSLLPTTAPPVRRPFRRAVWRGLGIVLPPLLTVVIFIWAWNTIHQYVLAPSTRFTRDAWAARIADVRLDLSAEDPTVGGRPYTRLTDGSYVPSDVAEFVRQTSHGPLPAAGSEVYRRYVELKYLRPHVVVPVFLLLFVLSMYLLGQFVAAGIGRFFWNLIERFIQRLPLVRNVYTSVKQVTDFMFNERNFDSHEFAKSLAICGTISHRDAYSSNIAGINKTRRKRSTLASKTVQTVQRPDAPPLDLTAWLPGRLDGRARCRTCVSR